MEYASLFVPLFVLVVGAALLVVASRSSREKSLSQRVAGIEQRLTLITDKLGLRTELPDFPDVVQELQRGDKVRAIKLYRQATGQGLVEAKYAVEELARRYGLPVSSPKSGTLPLDARLSLMKQQVDTLAEHFDIQEPEPELTGVLQELRRGRKIQAIKAYRQATGTDLITAKSAVEDLARSHGI